MERVEKLKKRSEVESKYKWNVEEMYESDEQWEEDFQKAKKLCPELLNYKGKLKNG